MSWVCKFDRRALRELKKLGLQAQARIIAYLEERIQGAGDPRDASANPLHPHGPACGAIGWANSGLSAGLLIMS